VKKEDWIVMDEKRRAKRLAEKDELTITTISEGKKPSKVKIIYHLSKDISMSGARIQANMFLPIGSLLKIDITLKNPHQMITAFGKVKWIRSLFADESYEAGLEFVHTSSDTIQQLADYISEKQKFRSFNPG
jgi:PilZ domain.